VLTAVLVTRNSETGTGAPAPGAAVTGFLDAMYTNRDAKSAAAFVCAAANDEGQLSAKVQEIEGYASKYKTPQFKWAEPKVDGETKERANVSVKVTMTTGDEKSAEQQLKFTVINSKGWRVCEVQ
jgi:hypothetical protein